MKEAKIVPIYKDGIKKDPSNYRPISILSVFAKILEGFTCEALTKFLEKHNIIYPHQYGFQKGKNTTDALMKFVSKIQDNFENKLQTITAYIDLKKAFDTCHHPYILLKLEAYGIRGTPLQWFSSYLNGRAQFVQSSTTVSERRTVTYGVPQGSNLGPVLFLLYINDLPNCINSSEAVLFADDTTITAVANEHAMARTLLETDLLSLARWLNTNKLSMNVGKSKICHFTPTNTKQIDSITINENALEICNSVKYLGVYIDDHLNWKAHIEYLSIKLNKQIGILKYARTKLKKGALRTIYMSLSHSILLYGLEIWGTALPTILHPVKIAQNKLLRTISFSHYRTSIKPISRNLKILPLEYEFQNRTLLAAFKIKGNEESAITINTQHAHSYPTRYAQSNIPIPTTRLHRHGKKGIRMTLINAFNSLPNDLKALHPAKPKLFKSKIKQFPKT
jgi:hypothetical protein